MCQEGERTFVVDVACLYSLCGGKRHCECVSSRVGEIRIRLQGADPVASSCRIFVESQNDLKNIRKMLRASRQKIELCPLDMSGRQDGGVEKKI